MPAPIVLAAAAMAALALLGKARQSGAAGAAAADAQLVPILQQTISASWVIPGEVPQLYRVIPSYSPGAAPGVSMFVSGLPVWAHRDVAIPDAAGRRYVYLGAVPPNTVDWIQVPAPAARPAIPPASVPSQGPSATIPPVPAPAWWPPGLDYPVGAPAPVGAPIYVPPPPMAPPMAPPPMAPPMAPPPMAPPPMAPPMAPPPMAPPPMVLPGPIDLSTPPPWWPVGAPWPPQVPGVIMPPAPPAASSTGAKPSWWPADLTFDGGVWPAQPPISPQVLTAWRRRGSVDYARNTGSPDAARLAAIMLADQLRETAFLGGSPLKIRTGQYPAALASFYGGTVGELAALNPAMANGITEGDWANWQINKIALLPATWSAETKPYPPRPGRTPDLG